MNIWDKIRGKSKGKIEPEKTNELNIKNSTKDIYYNAYESYVKGATELKEECEKVGIDCNIDIPQSFEEYCDNKDYFVDESLFTLPKIEEELKSYKDKQKTDNLPKNTPNLEKQNFGYSYNESLGNAVDSYYDGVNQVFNERSSDLADYITKSSDEFDSMMRELGGHEEKTNSGRRR